MSESNLLPALPKGWIWTIVNDVGSLIRGVSYNKLEASKQRHNEFIPILRATNINKQLNFDDLVYVPIQLVQPEQLIKKFDVILAMSSGSKDLVGKSAQANIDFFGSFGTFCGLLRPVKGLDQRYFGLFFQSPNYRKKIATLSSGIGINNLRKGDIESIAFPLPPLQEQHCIVNKIEELFTQLDAGVASLKKVQAQLKRYRQAILKAAFEGKLTHEWSKQHKGIGKDAHTIITDIRKNTSQKDQSKLNNYSNIDITLLEKLPEGWIWSKLGQLSDMSAGKAFLKSEYSEKGVKLLQIANVSFGKIVWDVVTYLPEDYLTKYPELSLKKGDMLIALNRPVLDGKLKIGILKSMDSPSILYQRVGRFDLYNPILKDYIFYYAQSPSFINYFNKCLQGIEIPFINKPVLLNALIPLSPLEEQKMIVKEIERIFSIYDEIESVIETSLKQAENLRQSILKRAFEGNLVPQDPTNASALVLLEGIKAEKALAAAELKRNKQVQTKSPKRKIKHGN